MIMFIFGILLIVIVILAVTLRGIDVVFCHLWLYILTIIIGIVLVFAGFANRADSPKGKKNE